MPEDTAEAINELLDTYPRDQCWTSDLYDNLDGATGDICDLDEEAKVRDYLPARTMSEERQGNDERMMASAGLSAATQRSTSSSDRASSQPTESLIPLPPRGKIEHMSVSYSSRTNAVSRGLATEMALQSIALEGGRIERRFVPILMEYVDGRVDAHEVVRYIRQQYGLE